MKSASSVANKWQTKAGSSASDYQQGASNTTKDQSALAAAAVGNWKAGLDAAFAAGSFAKGLLRSGKAGWLAGITQKGVSNYQTGVSASSSASKYATNSGRYDSARSAADSVARGPKGSPGNLQRVAAVVAAERAAKLGK